VRIKIGFAVLSLGLAVALFAGATVASADASGTIKGKMVNKSAQGDAVAGQTVELIAYDSNGTEKGRQSTTVAADGTFSFAGLPTTGQNYIATSKYLGVTYISEEIAFGANETAKDVELDVYSTTNDPKVLTVSRSHMIIDVDPANKLLTVLEAYVVDVKGDRTYVGGEQKATNGQPQTLRLKLPDGATHVQFGDGISEDRASFTDGMVIDTSPVQPGGRQVVLSYFVPYSPPDATISRSLEYPVDMVSVVIHDVGQQVTSGDLTAADPLSVGGENYINLQASNVPAGKTIAFKLANIPASLPSPAGSGLPQNEIVLAVGGLAVVGLGLGVAYPLLRRRRGRGGLVARPQASETLVWETLVQEIATLDDEYEAGTLPQDEYQRQRNEKKAQLLELSRHTGRS